MTHFGNSLIASRGTMALAATCVLMGSLAFSGTAAFVSTDSAAAKGKKPCRSVPSGFPGVPSRFPGVPSGFPGNPVGGCARPGKPW